MSCALLDHRQNRPEYRADGADFSAIHILRAGDGVKVAEQLIRPVNQVHIHRAQYTVMLRLEFVVMVWPDRP